MMKEILDIAMESAVEAGEMILSRVGSTGKVTTKADTSLVTEVDAAAEKIIVERIAGAFPAHGIMGEEGTMTGNDDGYLWIIDPLDGTHNFIHGIPLFGVSVGVVYKREFVAGAIYLPVTNELFAAEKGAGATKNGAPITVSPVEKLSSASLSYDSGISRITPLKTEVLGAFGTRVFNIRMTGASSVLLSWVAEGKLDVAIEFDDKPWDFAAGAIIVSEAGGRFTNLENGHADYRSVGYIASNGAIHDEAFGVIDPVRRRYYQM